jgi:tetratricopeptide (TPR) repeat protein
MPAADYNWNTAQIRLSYLVQLRKFEEALAFLSEEESPQEALLECLYIWRGLIYVCSNQFCEELESYDKAAEISSDITYIKQRRAYALN